MSRDFYIHFIKLSSILAIIFGWIAVLGAINAFGTPWLLFLDIIEPPFGTQAPNLDLIAQGISLFFGSVTIALGGLIFMLTKTWNKDIRKAILYSLSSWFILDTAGSLLIGLPCNVFFNVLFLVLFLVPLLKLRKWD